MFLLSKKQNPIKKSGSQLLEDPLATPSPLDFRQTLWEKLSNGWKNSDVVLSRLFSDAILYLSVKTILGLFLLLTVWNRYCQAALATTSEERSKVLTLGNPLGVFEYHSNLPNLEGMLMQNDERSLQQPGSAPAQPRLCSWSETQKCHVQEHWPSLSKRARYKNRAIDTMKI